MGKLLNYAEQLDEVQRLVQEENYSINDAIKIIKERNEKDGGTNSCSRIWQCWKDEI